MDEILIEDKRYVSSKRAAEMTGYAKDYVGQLCREGRVPARLIGRSWYVLAAAIKDHRFGMPPPEKEATKQDEPQKDFVVHRDGSSTWQPPRYESEKLEALPFINKLAAPMVVVNEERKVHEDQEAGAAESMESMHTAWKSWFARTPAPTSAEDAVEMENYAHNETLGETPLVREEPQEEEGENVPIHTLTLETEEEDRRSALVISVEKNETKEDKPETLEVFLRTESAPHASKSNAGYRVLKSIFISIAGFTILIGLIGTGTVKTSISSNRVINMIAGVTYVNN